ncbi:MAG: hypothetical protein C0617_16450 [Desulfuromonas sp.]|uniref:hypothetical protein n=1 Tax=Desulfuromonas sp. TaxID=892 RepID=UPI000CAC38DE|nr:hypothetical protein [Desulfuromonas sp.]PLX81681.1 MAG: hypothetical protein C0617_16450 [Desulfuromonas sp.]
MKRLVLFVVFFVASASVAFATQIGPAMPAADHGQVSVGAGYLNHQAEWDDVEIEQNRIYVHLGYGLGMEDEPRGEVYLRGGAADLEAEDLDGDYEPFFIGGVKGAFYETDVFAWGIVLQGGYFFDVEDEDTGVEIQDAYELEVALPFELHHGALQVYAGPVGFIAKGDAEDGTGTTELEEDNNVGGFGGIVLDFDGFSIGAEAQYKSDFSAGGMVSFQF